MHYQNQKRYQEIKGMKFVPRYDMKYLFIILFIVPLTVLGQSSSLDNARQLLQDKKYATAEQTLDAYLNKRPNDIGALELIGDTYGQQEKWDEAIDAYEKLVEMKPNVANYHYKYGGALGMVPREILKKVRRIEITTRGLVNEVFSGEYHSVFKGRGMTFSEVREYQYGDDIRSIDWNVTARTGTPFVKIFEEERELTVVLVVDVSASGDFGTRERFKRDLAAELSAVLAFSAIKNNDKIGLILFSDRVEKFVPPRKGRRHVLRVLRELLYHKPEGKGTDIRGALEYLSRVVPKRAVVFLVSDFLGQDFLRPLSVAGKRHDLIAIRMKDLRDEEIPEMGLVEFEDPETGQRLVVNTSDPDFRNAFSERARQRMSSLDRDFLRSKVDVIDIQTGQPYVEPLMRFFHRRMKRFR